MPITPNLPSQAYKTYRIYEPLRTHWRAATCAEVDCPNYLNGFRVLADETTDLGQRQAHYLRHDKTRAHKESRGDTGLTVFEFPPGTTCFRADEHRTRRGLPELFLVQPGDWRSRPRRDAIFQHARPQDWVEDFGEHQQRIADQREKG